MFSDWKPSPHVPEVIRKSGMTTPEPEQFAFALGEFITYWMTKPTERTQLEWDNSLVKNLKSDHLQGKSKTGPKGTQKFDPVGYVNRDRKDV